MKEFLELQKKMMDSFSVSDPTKLMTSMFNGFSKYEDFIKLCENNLKFHNAAIKYHSSIVEMTEAIKDNLEIINKK